MGSHLLTTPVPNRQLSQNHQNYLEIYKKNLRSKHIHISEERKRKRRRRRRRRKRRRKEKEEEEEKEKVEEEEEEKEEEKEEEEEEEEEDFVVKTPKESFRIRGDVIHCKIGL